ncbi:MAG: aminotransferase class I/II-fold pyridoxal phosphate-dependent enzyme [Bacteroidetes bacterium]|nr:aminotransferase class I/II-fold pyridoxal phosphate-dependent enzyme [Bacteroidota bacterium]
MRLSGSPKAILNEEARDFINLYASLGERAENFLPEHVMETLRSFVRVSYEEQLDPHIQSAEINRYVLELKESLPGYTETNLMLAPTEDSKAFRYSARRNAFKTNLRYAIDHELVDEKDRNRLTNILRLHDFSVGTPPVTQKTIDFLYKVMIGDEVRVLRKFRDLIGINDNVEEAQWNYMLDLLDQMVVQSTHYTSAAEKAFFLSRTESSVNFKGLNGLIRTLVSGTAETAVKLLREEVFTGDIIQEITYENADSLINSMKQDPVSLFAVRVSALRENILGRHDFLPFLNRTIFLDDSAESKATNTCLVFAFHNGIINTLNKIHTKKLGAPANTQMNLRLILDKVNEDNLRKFINKIGIQISEYEREMKQIREEQLAKPDQPDQDIMLFKFDEFARQVIKDIYTLSKLQQFIQLIIRVKTPSEQRKLNRELVKEFEERTRDYFYSGNPKLEISTILEGGGRTQIKTFGEFLLQRKLKTVDQDIVHNSAVILDVLPDAYQRTLHNHFHKNFGINLFLEKYKEYLTKVENTADNKGRFKNLIIDLGIKEKYELKSPEDQAIIQDFVSKLSTLDKSSVSDDVQMIIRDLLFWENRQPNPYIYFVEEASWEYRDLFPPDRFDINPFDINIELFENGRVDFERLQLKLERIRDTFHLFDDTGTLWDRFCENATFVINDPANPTGYSDFNNQAMIRFLKFLNKTKITLFLDEAYNDAVKVDDPEEPKWRTISRYIMNNFGTYPTISMVTSLSTTKNLGATGDRLGSLAATPARKDVVDFARKLFSIDRANTNSLFLLVNTLEVAQLAKRIKVRMDENLPKDASRYKIKEKLIAYIKTETAANVPDKIFGKSGRYGRLSLFEGSPLHLFLLDELKSLDQLDVLELPDDFKYKDEPFFSYYKEQLVRKLNGFRVNKEFRKESGTRFEIAREEAKKIIKETGTHDEIDILESDGSYLFNLQFLDPDKFVKLEPYCLKLAQERGLAVLPYPAGFVRFSLGDYLDGTNEAYEFFRAEVAQAFSIFIRQWKNYIEGKPISSNISDIISEFGSLSDQAKSVKSSLLIRDIKSLYLPSPKHSGVNINTIATSENSVLEFYDNVGQCPDLISFIRSQAFTKVYENLLPQIYKSIPAISDWDIHEVIAYYGKSTILKYISSKLNFLPDDHILDGPNELLVMKEILIALERTLFSDAKVKLLALRVNEDDRAGDLAKLEGYNQILKKFIRELLLHFNLPFEQDGEDPTLEELFLSGLEIFIENTGITESSIDLDHQLVSAVRLLKPQKERFLGDQSEAIIRSSEVLLTSNIQAPHSPAGCLLNAYLITSTSFFSGEWNKMINELQGKLHECNEGEARLIAGEFLLSSIDYTLSNIWSGVEAQKTRKISADKLRKEVRSVILFLTQAMNKTRSTTRYTEYNHILLLLLEHRFSRQNSANNEMIQHGYTLHTGFTMDNDITKDKRYSTLGWINDLLQKCGVIVGEKDVQTHTRIATDAKKREFPFHKIDRVEEDLQSTDTESSDSNQDFIKQMKTRPTAVFFGDRMNRFVGNLDAEDYRCKLFDQGLVKELYIFQKSYLKYLTDNYRLLGTQTFTLNEIKEFVPDIIVFYGAPEKVISYPRIGFFDLDGPRGKIKTLLTPLKRKVDYFGDIKKPRLTLLNEKVKEMGGMPVHGSLFAVEEDDGTVFVVQISGDSGVGKSEMLAALMLKWMRKDLKGIRSIKLIAGDMFHVFPDDKGNLYGIGTELGDFSRVTDFDPEYIKQYSTLFESSADSNIEDLNSRSTISGFCDISMPYKIDIMLTASNFSRDEAGIRRYANPENFILYRESHGERKEKATSQDSPHFQRTLLRYTGDKNIVDVLSRHGSYLDDILNWITDPSTGKDYLGSSYKMIDKIDLDKLINQIFESKSGKHSGQTVKVKDIRFDIIKNRFTVNASTDNDDEVQFELDRSFFSSVFGALASTPAGNPFIAEEGEVKIKKDLIQILKGGKNGKGQGRNIQLGILSTDLGKKGKEISGPQTAAQDLVKLIREVRLQKPEIPRKKQIVRESIRQAYKNVLPENVISNEVFRYNFYLYQLEEMRKAKFVRIDQKETSVDLTNLRGFKPVDPKKEFSPLLLTPHLNAELSSYSETFEQIISLPNNLEFGEEFLKLTENLYLAEGYSEETLVNNLITQLLLLKGNLAIKDLAKGRITEKINRETVAAAKWAVMQKLSQSETGQNHRKPEQE